VSGRGRRVAVILVALAIVLSAGRWVSVFVAQRLWESTVSEAAAVAGARRALLGLSLELLVLFLSVAWFVVNLAIAARNALPDRPPPERPQARLWPSRLPRWTLAVAGVVLGVLLGSGAGQWLDELLLSLDGFVFGVADPLLGVDLGFFLRDFPLWLALQDLATGLAAVGLAAVLAVHTAGAAVAIVERRLWVSPQVRGHLAILLATLALALAWGSVLEEFRLAAGLRGPLVHSEFLVRSLVSEIQAGLGAAVAVTSFLWWVRFRGAAVFVMWLLLGLTLLAGRVLPFGTVVATKDETWRAAARALDSVAFALAEVNGPPLGLPVPSVELTPTLWDEPILSFAAAADSSVVTSAGKGWIVAGGSPRPVWFMVREMPGRSPALLALADDRVAGSGAILAWREGDSATSPGAPVYRDFPSHGLRSTAPDIDISTEAKGIALDTWTKRVMLAWALQSPKAFTAPSGSRIGWRLDPAVRLNATAPFARWSRPRARISGGAIVWTSDGVLASGLFPSSGRIEWPGGPATMVRSAFLGTVDAATGSVRIFRRSPSDSLAAAWGRITGPLIEPPGAIPADLRVGDPYPEEVFLAQARALANPAWGAGQIERDAEGREVVPPSAPGGGEVLVPLLGVDRRQITGFLLARRTPSGDSVRMIRLDSAHAIERASALKQRWERFPFQQALHDSVRASGGRFEPGKVRHAIARDGIAAYQPAWAVPATGRAQLAMVDVMLDRNLGTGRTLDEAWRNLRGHMGPIAAGSGPEAVLEQARRWMQRADSALKRGDLQELGRALAYLRDLLEPPGKR